MPKTVFHIRVSNKGFCMSLTDKPTRPGYTVKAEDTESAFDLVEAYRNGAAWANQAALQGDLTVHHRNQ